MCVSVCVCVFQTRWCLFIFISKESNIYFGLHLYKWRNPGENILGLGNVRFYQLSRHFSNFMILFLKNFEKILFDGVKSVEHVLEKARCASLDNYKTPYG